MCPGDWFPGFIKNDRCGQQCPMLLGELAPASIAVRRHLAGHRQHRQPPDVASPPVTESPRIDRLITNYRRCTEWDLQCRPWQILSSMTPFLACTGGPPSSPRTTTSASGYSESCQRSVTCRTIEREALQSIVRPLGKLFGRDLGWVIWSSAARARTIRTRTSTASAPP